MAGGNCPAAEAICAHGDASGATGSRPLRRDPVEARDESNAFEAFRRWLDDDDRTAKSARRGEALARERREAMRHLMANDPSRALREALAPSRRAGLPGQISRHLEELVSGYGTIHALYDCDAIPKAMLAVSLGNRLYTACVPSGWSMPGPGGRRVRLEGIALGSLMAVAGAGTGSSGVAPRPSPEWTTGEKSLLYLVVQYAGQHSPPTTRQAAEAALAQVNQFFQSQSYQQTEITATVTGPVQLPMGVSHYNDYGLGLLYTDAVDAAALAGWNAADYDFVIIRHAGSSWGGGVAVVGGKGAWVQTDDWRVIAHELGHNYGLHHANGWHPATTEPCGPGWLVEYGDPFDMMGPLRGSFNSYQRWVLHWMPESAVACLSGNGVYRLHAFDAAMPASNHLLALRVARDARDYWLDYRGGFQTGDYAPYALNGLHIRWSAWPWSRGGSALVDTTPGTPRRFDDAPLAVGHTYSDWETGMHVTVIGRSETPGEWLDVAVNLDPPPNNRPPVAALLASATNVVRGTPVFFLASAADPDGHSLSYGWSATVDGNLVPLRIESNSPTITWSWPDPGEYEVRCRVSDAHGGFAVVKRVVRVEQPPGFSVSGTVRDELGFPLAGALVFALDPSVSTNGSTYVTHPSYYSARTDAAGRYALFNLGAGSYAIRGMPSGTHTFTPSSGSNVVAVGPSLSGLHFVAAPKPAASIQGVVMDGSAVVSNAVVSVPGHSTVSRPDGTFTLSNVPPGSYMLGAARSDHQFIGTKNPVYLDGSDSMHHPIHRVLYEVAGEIRGVAAPVVVGTGEPGRQVAAEPDFEDFSKPWRYTLAVPRGVWNLEAFLEGGSFSSDGFSNPVVVAGVDRPYLSPNGIQATAFTNLHFTATPGTTRVIRGRTTFEEWPLPFVAVSAGERTVWSDSLGQFALAGLAPGNYALIPSRPGFEFTPATTWVAVAGDDVTGIEFEGVFPQGSPDGLSVEPMAGSVFRINLSGVPGRTYMLQHTEGLHGADWTDAATLISDWQGRGSFTNPAPPGVTRRFYRTARGAAP